MGEWGLRRHRCCRPRPAGRGSSGGTHQRIGRVPSACRQKNRARARTLVSGAGSDPGLGGARVGAGGYNEARAAVEARRPGLGAARE
eukprot:10025691-Alexandrium_andersonii.AAC.1